MTLKTFQFFKTGTHTSAANEPISFSEADLQHSAKLYATDKWLAPLVINHPKNDAPPLGSVKKLTLQDGNLYATAQFSEALIQQGRDKKFKGVSARWFRPTEPGNPQPGTWYLRHIGFLDTVNPAVKGMTPVAFSEPGDLASYFDSCSDLDVAFSEAPIAMDYERERQVLHAMAQFLAKRDSISYTAAAHQADRAIQKYKDRHTNASQMDAERVEFHEAALDYMAAIPGVSYMEAARLILSLT